MANNFSKLKDLNLHIEKNKWVPSRINLERSMPRNITQNLKTIKMKKEPKQLSERKGKIAKGMKIWLIIDFLSIDAWEKNRAIKVLRGKMMNLKFYTQLNHHSESGWKKRQGQTFRDSETTERYISEKMNPEGNGRMKELIVEKYLEI